MSYNGYYLGLPSRWCGFDSRHVLQKKSDVLWNSIALFFYLCCGGGISNPRVRNWVHELVEWLRNPRRRRASRHVLDPRGLFPDENRKFSTRVSQYFSGSCSSSFKHPRAKRLACAIHRSEVKRSKVFPPSPVFLYVFSGFGGQARHPHLH